MVRSSYSYTIEEKKLTIIDLNRDGFKSVTNDMEQVLKDIHLQEKRDLSSMVIIYQDSMKRFDGVTCKNVGSFKNPDYELAIYPLPI